MEGAKRGLVVGGKYTAEELKNLGLEDTGHTLSDLKIYDGNGKLYLVQEIEDKFELYLDCNRTWMKGPEKP